MSASRLRAWSELLRLPNLPTVASNAVLGTWIGFAAQGRSPGVPFAGWFGPGSGEAPAMAWSDLVLLGRSVAGLCGLYLVGLILNDLLDIETDRRERPARPLPSGRVAVAWAVVVAAALALASLWLLLAASRAGTQVVLVVSLFAAIVLYDLLHRRLVAAVVLPAVCRALAILVAACATLPESAFERGWFPLDARSLSAILAPSAAVGMFVLAVSVVARREVDPGSPPTCPACGQPVLRQSSRCAECGGEVQESSPRVARRGDLGSRPWWVIGTGLLGAVAAILLGAVTWTPSLEDPFLAVALLRGVVIIGCLGAWLFVATRSTAETPVPRLVGRWLGSLCLLDAALVAPHGVAPVVACLALFATSHLLARRLAGS